MSITELISRKLSCASEKRDAQVKMMRQIIRTISEVADSKRFLSCRVNGEWKVSLIENSIGLICSIEMNTNGKIICFPDPDTHLRCIEEFEEWIADTYVEHFSSKWSYAKVTEDDN